MPVTIALDGRRSQKKEKSRSLNPPSFNLFKSPRSVAKNRMVLAVAGGVASLAPDKAVKLAAKDKGTLLAAKIDEAKLDVLFDAVEKVVDDPDSAPKTTDADRVVARRLRIRPEYVAAVRTAGASDAGALTAGLAWSASLDVERLSDTAELANREIQLQRIPTMQVHQEELEERVKKLETQLAALSAPPKAAKKPAAKKKASTQPKQATQTQQAPAPPASTQTP